MSESLLFRDGTLAVDARGKTTVVSGREKARQDILWALLTDPPKDSNLGRLGISPPLYSGLRNLIGSVPSGDSTMGGLIVMEASNGIKMLIEAQKENPALGSEEEIKALTTVSTRQLDQTSAVVYIEVGMVEGGDLPLGFRRISTEHQIPE